MAATFLAMAGAQVVSGLITSYQTGRVAKQQERLARGLQSELDALEASRQEIIDPSRNIVDRSAMIQNQMANLQVATQAAEFQAEEADIALANTLATARQTGLGAGGATALAQAALRSKRGIAASIEQQEARNVLLRAQGAAAAEQRRLLEGGRVDRARMAGDQFQFAVREARETAKLDRTSNLLDQASARAMANRQASQAALAGAIGAAAGAGIGAALGMGPKPKQALTTPPATEAGDLVSKAPTTQTPNSIMDSSGKLKVMKPLQGPDSLFSFGDPTKEASMAEAFAEEASIAKALNPMATVVGGTNYNSSMTTRSPFATTTPAPQVQAMPTSFLSGPFGYGAPSSSLPSFPGALGARPDAGIYFDRAYYPSSPVILKR